MREFQCGGAAPNMEFIDRFDIPGRQHVNVLSQGDEPLPYCVGQPTRAAIVPFDV
jgi:hypothetical protein